MSKSLGNVVNPDDVVDEYGADTLRLYEMFIGDFEKAAPWNTSSIKGCKRFLDKIWGMSEKLLDGDAIRPELEAVANRTIKKVGEDIDSLKANTAIAQLMIAGQVNGKVKARIQVPAAIESADAIAQAKAEPAVAAAIEGKTIAKEIYVKGKLVNIAVKG